MLCSAALQVCTVSSQIITLFALMLATLELFFAPSQVEAGTLSNWAEITNLMREMKRPGSAAAMAGLSKVVFNQVWPCQACKRKQECSMGLNASGSKINRCLGLLWQGPSVTWRPQASVSLPSQKSYTIQTWIRTIRSLSSPQTVFGIDLQIMR